MAAESFAAAVPEARPHGRSTMLTERGRLSEGAAFGPSTHWKRGTSGDANDGCFARWQLDRAMLQAVLAAFSA